MTETYFAAGNEVKLFEQAFHQRIPGMLTGPTGCGKTRLVGDVNYKEALEVAGAVTPVPGGVGPMTIACVILNTLRAACASAGLPEPKV